MKFEFIDNGAIDRRTRRQIRSHAAKGHNAGRKLTRPSKKASTRVELARVHMPTLQGKPRRNENVISVFSPASSNLLSALPSFLQQVAKSTGLRLVQRTVVFFSEIRYSPALEPVLDHAEEPRTKFVDPIFQDEAYFHGALAVFMSAFPRVTELATTGKEDNTSVRLRHFGLALRMINARLSGQDAASDNNVKAVLLLGMYERYTRSYGAGLVHLDGLCRMLDLRGGLDDFSRTSQGLVRKILRADLECALHLGTPTRLALRDIERVIPRSQTLMVIPLPSPPAQPPFSGSNSATSSTHPSLPPRAAASPTLRHDICRASGTLLHGISPVLSALIADATHAAQLLHLATSSIPTATTAQPAVSSGLPARLASAAVHDTYLLLGYRLQALSPFLLDCAKYHVPPATTEDPVSTTTTTTTVATTSPADRGAEPRGTNAVAVAATKSSSRNPFPGQTGLDLGLMGLGLGSGMGMGIGMGIGIGLDYLYSEESDYPSSQHTSHLRLSAPTPAPAPAPSSWQHTQRNPLDHDDITTTTTTTTDAALERALCLGLTAFIASFLWGGSWCGLTRLGDVAWLGRAARDLVGNGGSGGLILLLGGRGDEEPWKWEVVLWMVCVGEAAGLLRVSVAGDAVQAEEGEEGGAGGEGWVVRTVREVAGVLGLREWGDVKVVLGRFPWVEALHGERTRALWERSIGVV